MRGKAARDVIACQQNAKGNTGTCKTSTTKDTTRTILDRSVLITSFSYGPATLCTSYQSEISYQGSGRPRGRITVHQFTTRTKAPCQATKQ